MAASALGFSVFRAGWTGTITLGFSGGNVIVTPSSHTSPLEFCAAIVAGSIGTAAGFSITVNGHGKIVFNDAASFTITTTADIHTRLGMSGSSLSGASTYTALRVAPGSIYPYTSEGLRYTLDVPTPRGSGISMTDRAMLIRTPGTDWKSPGLSYQVLRERLLESVEALALADTPGKVSVYVGTTAITHHLGKSTFTTQDPRSGWSRVALEVVL